MPGKYLIILVFALTVLGCCIPKESDRAVAD